MAEHTPGPWEADEDYDVWANEMPGGWRAIICTLAEGRFASHPSVALSREVMDANARLIAAAPDLLGELASLVAKIEAAGWHKSETESARNALRKAGQTAPDSAPAS